MKLPGSEPCRNTMFFDRDDSDSDMASNPTPKPSTNLNACHRQQINLCSPTSLNKHKITTIGEMYCFVTELLHCTQRTKNYSCQPCKNSVNLGCDPSKYRTAYNKILSNLLPKWSMAAPDNDNNLDLVTSDKIKTRCRT